MKINEYDTDDLFDSKSLESIEHKIEFESLLARLSKRDRLIVVLYAFRHTQKEIGEIIGYTQARISQILSKIYILP
jgi:RNA polymerase sigma factor (sigma-70 family)